MVGAAGILLVLVALALALAPLPPSFVEAYYSSGLYPPMQAAITSASNAFPFALLDAVIAVTIGIWLLLAVRDIARRRNSLFGTRWLRVLARILTRTVTLGAAAYLVFLIVWGFNYRRVPLTGKLQFDATAAAPEAAR